MKPTRPLPFNLDDERYNLIGALATLIDAVTTGAPRDFLEAAAKDGAQAIQDATGELFEKLPNEFFTWGKTTDYDERDRLAARWGQPKAEPEPTSIRWTCPQCKVEHSDRNDQLAASFAYCQRCREEPDLKREATDNYIDTEVRNALRDAEPTDTD